MGRSWATEETKYVLRPGKQRKQLGNMHNLISKTFLNKNPPTGQCWSPGRQMFNHCKIRSKCEHTSDTSHSSLQCIGVEKNLFGVKSGEMHQAENGGGARPWVFALWCSLPQRLTSLSLITIEIMSYSFHHCCQHIDLWAPARQCTSTFSPLFILKNFRWMLSKTLNGGWKIIKMWNKSPVLIPLSQSSAIWLFRYAIKCTLKNKCQQSRKV